MIQARAKFEVDHLPQSAKSNLVRLTAAHANNHVEWQVIALGQASEDDMEEYSIMFTQVLADFHSATGDEEYIKVTSREAADDTDPLPIAIYP